MPYKSAESKKQWYARNKKRVAETNQQWAVSHPEKTKAYRKAWRKANPDKVVASDARRRLAKLERIAGRPRPSACEVCGAKFMDRFQKRGHFDHDHKTGKFRGWLCWSCNIALGLLRDDPGRLQKLIAYLEVPR